MLDTGSQKVVANALTSIARSGQLSQENANMYITPIIIHAIQAAREDSVLSAWIEAMESLLHFFSEQKLSGEIWETTLSK